MAWIKSRNRQPRAGRYAQAQYEELKARWRQRVLKPFRLVLWPLIALSAVGLLLPSSWSWTFGFVGGASYGFWLYVRDAVPPHIERWLEGAEGERMTERALEPLERQGWSVAHDLQGRYGNIDHLVVGPAGVFLLDSKKWSGEVTVTDGVATITPIDNPDAAWSATGVARAMRAASAANKAALEALTGVKAWTQPVVVIWAPFAQQSVRGDGVVYVHGDHLAEWLVAQPSRLDQTKAGRIAEAIGS